MRHESEFPILIRWEDGRTEIFYSPEDIPIGRLFVVIQTRVQWEERKPLDA